MTNEERDLITQFIQRVGGAPASGFSGSVPATVPPPPPVDPQADALIQDLFTRYPETRYRMTQMAFVQEHALVEAQNQINHLQWQIQQMQAQAAPPPQQASPWGAAAQQGPAAAPQPGLFGRMFGAGTPPQPQYQQPQYAPPPPQYAPGFQPGMFQRQGSGFLGSALTTAAGVAGGMFAGNALMNLFSGSHSGFGGGGFGGGFGGGYPQQVDYVPVEQGGSPWGGDQGAAPAVDPYDVGGAPKDVSTDSGWQSTDDGSSTDSGWQDTGGGGDDGGWTDTSNT